jgi:hypothetical protein
MTTMPTPRSAALERGGLCIPLLRPHPWSRWTLFHVPNVGGLQRATTARQERQCMRCGLHQHRAVMQ